MITMATKLTLLAFYEKCPKMVFMNIAVSLAQRIIGGNATEKEIVKFFHKEWKILHQNKIVTQKQPKMEK